MSNNYFDDILKNSMETPRAIPFDESAWERMEQRLPKPAMQSTWKTWLKFLPIAIGMLGLLAWNICLQREINYMQKHPNVIVQKEDAQPKVIYRIDTIYQITEKRITEKNIEKYLAEYINDNGLSHTNNRFITPESSSVLIPNPFITSNSKNIISGSYNPVSLKNNLITPNSNSNFFTSSFYNPHFSNLNIPENNYAIQEDSIQLNNQPVFAHQTSSYDNSSNEKSPLDNENITTNSDLNNSSNEDINDLAIEDQISDDNTLDELEKTSIDEVQYFHNFNNTNHIDIVGFYRPSKIKPTFRSKLRFEEFSVGVSNSFAGDIANNSTLLTYGLHAGAYILPNTSLEVEINYLNNNRQIYGNLFYPNPLPYPSAQQIPADFYLNGISLDITSVQMSLGLKRIVFKDEHIRPFGEIGWLPSKEFSGTAFYSYTKREGNEYISHPMDLISLQSTDYLKWNLSRVYAGGGLSFSLLKGKVDLDLGLRFTQSLNSLLKKEKAYNNNLTKSSALGSFASLTYNF